MLAIQGTGRPEGGDLRVGLPSGIVRRGSLGLGPLPDDLAGGDKDGEDLKHEDGEVDPEGVSNLFRASCLI